ncbi:hypothetical protein PoB_007297300 [Plakobranchus ocellatus]|uniref:Secreted protein n=1 Tax=Plakobranchus ocellatus TaxID=259542 RepID=A0AAV4DQ61_9GAST|nr:hypothetical protein PoB_007297300 [Plakobranchus ocellatus]
MISALISFITISEGVAVAHLVEGRRLPVRGPNPSPGHSIAPLCPPSTKWVGGESNKDPTPGSPMLGLSVGPNLLFFKITQKERFLRRAATSAEIRIPVEIDR